MAEIFKRKTEDKYNTESIKKSLEKKEKKNKKNDKPKKVEKKETKKNGFYLDDSGDCFTVATVQNTNKNGGLKLREKNDASSAKKDSIKDGTLIAVDTSRVYRGTVNGKACKWYEAMESPTANTPEGSGKSGFVCAGADC